MRLCCSGDPYEEDERGLKGFMCYISVLRKQQIRRSCCFRVFVCRPVYKQ